MTMTTWLVFERRTSVEMHDRLKAEPERLVTMPGTLALVDLLHDDPNVEVGVLTGNWEETGVAKMEQAGFDTSRISVRSGETVACTAVTWSPML